MIWAILMAIPKNRHKAYNWLAGCALNEPELFADLVRVAVSEQSLEEIDLDSVRVLSSKHFTEEGQGDHFRRDCLA